MRASLITILRLSVWKSLQRRQIFEAILVAIGFLAYFAVRGAVIQQPAIAFDHAMDLIALQRNWGFFWEDDLQNWIADDLFVVQAMNIIYFWLHFPLIIVFGIYLYMTARNKYTLMRDSLLISGTISLIVYWVYPVAPPRELPRLAAEMGQTLPPDVGGFIDTMQVYLGYAYQSQSTSAFVNPFAAMPSLHFGWDLLLGIGIIYAFWSHSWKWRLPAILLGVALPTMQVFSITMTANHFLIDAIAGGLVSVVGLALAAATGRWLYPLIGRQIQRLPWKPVREFLAPSEQKNRHLPGLASEPSPSRR